MRTSDPGIGGSRFIWPLQPWSPGALQNIETEKENAVLAALVPPEKVGN